RHARPRRMVTCPDNLLRNRGDLSSEPARAAIPACMQLVPHRIALCRRWLGCCRQAPGLRKVSRFARRYPNALRHQYYCVAGEKLHLAEYRLPPPRENRLVPNLEGVVRHRCRKLPLTRCDEDSPVDNGPRLPILNVRPPTAGKLLVAAIPKATFKR